MPFSDFDIDSLAAYLHLTPEQVRKMAERNKLPGRKVGGQWKFSRAEIHHWFEERIGLSDEDELVKVEQMLDRNTPATSHATVSIPEMLTPERIAVPLRARTRNSVIREMCEVAAASGALWVPDEMAEAIRAREELHPTALDNGVALLHPRRPMPSLYGESFLALGITSTGIPFGGPRGTLTDVFFLIASIDESIHLRVLARLSRLVQNNVLLDDLRAATSATEAWQLIHDADQALD